MNALITKKTWYFSVMLMAFAMISSIEIWAFDSVTHRAINERLAQKISSTGNYSVHQYLIEQLGLKNGVETEINGKWIQKHIIDGGEWEDVGGRSLNHFHNPLTDKGNWGGQSAILWATLPAGAQSVSPLASWNDVRAYYERALTDRDKASREQWFALTFQGVGQLMHLVQDMSVPAHTRNDAHLLEDGYENWCKQVTKEITEYKSYAVYGSYTPFNNTLFLIPQLFDSNQYNGSNPDITISSASIGLSEYANANFFSGDTINASSFSHPQTDSKNKYVLPYIGPSGIYHREYYLKDCSGGYCETSNVKNHRGYLLSAVDLNDYWRMMHPNASASKPIIPILDTNVYYDYAQLLIPRAIGYSAEVLKYFFRGKLHVEMREGSLNIKNISDETISDGKFLLYYDNAAGTRTLLAEANASVLAEDANQTLSFTPATEEVASYMLVFKGRLGNESGAVIGKHIPAGDLMVVTITLEGNPVLGEPLLKKVSFVWDPVNNRLKREPVGYDDEDFQKWYHSKQTAGNLMFLGGAHDIYEPHKLAPELTDSAYMEYHADYFDIGGEVFPETIYGTISIPNSPKTYTGIRTSQQFISIESNNNYRYDYLTTVDGKPVIVSFPYYFEDFSHYVLVRWYQRHVHQYDYEFWGPFGKFGSFTRRDSRDVEYGSITTDWEEIIKEYIPPWQEHDVSSDDSELIKYANNRRWYDSSMSGIYTDKILAHLYVVQFSRSSYKSVYIRPEDSTGYEKPDIEYWTFDQRVINVQAQAIFQNDGIEGVDWMAKGRTQGFETPIRESIIQAYLVNGIPGNEVRRTLITIEIVQ